MSSSAHPRPPSGGRALKFYALGPLDVRRIESLKDGPEVVGNRTRAKVVKNKLARSFRSAGVRRHLRPGSPRRGACSTSAWMSVSSRSRGPGSPTTATSSARDARTSATSSATTPSFAREIEEKIKAQLGVGLPRPPLPPSTPTTPSPRTRRFPSHRVPHDGARPNSPGRRAGAHPYRPGRARRDRRAWSRPHYLRAVVRPHWDRRAG